MLLRVPAFYDSFHCIAGQCTDTCCIGWEIDIDETSAKRYAALKGDFGDTLRQNIEDGHFKLLPGDRCPFLRQDGLCDMICHLGESSLCDICREHPRFVEVYGDIMEKGLGLCCEEAARLLLASKGTAISPIAFVEREIDDIPDEARDAILAERNHLFKILANHNKPLNERLVEMLDYAIETSGFDDFHADSSTTADHDLQIEQIHKSWINVLGKGESFGPAWDDAYKELAQVSRTLDAGNKRKAIDSSSFSQSVGLFTERDGEKIVAYLLFRYYGKSLFDGNSLTKVQFALYFWIMLQKFGNILAGTKIDAIKLLSKQTEYSEEIMAILEQEFIENPAFSALNFKRILTE